MRDQEESWSLIFLKGGNNMYELEELKKLMQHNWENTRTELKGNKEKFQSTSYDNWAYQECIGYICSNMDKDPIESCWNFRSIMDNSAMEATNKYAKQIFASGYEVATEILDYLILKREGRGQYYL